MRLQADLFEDATDETLDCFFNDCVRSAQRPSYQRCSGPSGALTCVVRVKCIGEMRLPVSVEAFFIDGSRQQARSETLADEDELVFEAPAPLDRVSLEPAGLMVTVGATATPAKAVSPQWPAARPPTRSGRST